MYHLLLLMHAAAGTAALSAFWTAGLARKGGALHARAGRVFLLAMCGIGITALPMALILLARGATTTAVFLLYLLLLTTSTCLSAWYAVRLKQDFARYRGRWYRALAGLTLAGSIAVFAYGAMLGQILLIGFSAVGLLRGVAMVRFLSTPMAPRWWLREHYRSMLGNGAATHVAFLSIGLNRLLPAAWMDSAHGLAWFGPLVILLAARLWLDRRYGGARVATSRAPALIAAE